MYRPIRLSLFLSLLALLSIQMTCNDILTGDEDTIENCIDEKKINIKTACPRNYDPVCGCNNVTYSNDCEAKKAGVTKWEKGECPCVVEALKTPDAPCTKEYKPVCGCDNITYPNECLAKNAGLTKWTPGKCNSTSDTDKPGLDCVDPAKATGNPCPENYDPVCGCDGKTYGNECEATSKGVLKWTPGKCDNSSTCIDETKVNPNQPCTKEYVPVCGCDGITYANKCLAEKAGLTRWVPGKCEDQCIDESKINPNQACTREYKPVCGCDGKTYGNQCEAEKAGVTKTKPGKCN